MSTQAISEAQGSAVAGAPPIELALQQPLGSTVQQVQDEDGNSSALYIGTTQVAVGTSTPTYPFTVAGDPNYDSLLQVHGQGNEATIEFLNDTDGLRWHMGSSVGMGNNTFILWNESDLVVLSIQNKVLTVNGTIVADGLTINGSTGVQGVQSYTTAPAGVNLQSLLVDTNTGMLYYV